MFDKDLALEILRQIADAGEKIKARFQAVASVGDFTGTPAGHEKMDAI